MNKIRENKQKLLHISIELFSRKGFNGTSTRDIANAMSMSISNIYHYFGSKEGLLLAILEKTAQKLLSELHKANRPDPDPVEGFRHLLSTHLHLYEKFSKETKIFFLDEEHLTEEGDKINRGIQEEILEIYRSNLRALQNAGYLQGRSITILAFNVLGIINWHLKWFRPDGPMSLEQVSDEIISFILNGALGA